MFTLLSSTHFRRPVHLTRPKHRPAPTIEGLEGRVLLAFNAYIAGLNGGATFTDFSFTFSTTGQAAKHWEVNWGDGTTQPFDAPNPGSGWTAPFTATHHYDLAGNYAVSGTATSITNATATAVLQENSAFGNVSSTGKEVQGLSDTNSSGMNIATVVDENNNTYVASIDGKRFAVTRFKPNGQIDSGTGGWTSTGTYILQYITGINNQDTPRAMAIDTFNQCIFVAGTSNNQWAIARINYNAMGTNPMGWTANLFTGTATGIWVDATDVDHSDPLLGVVGTTSSSQIQMAELHEKDGFDFHGGSLNLDWGGGDGWAVAPNSLYAIPSPYNVTASSGGILEGDDIRSSDGTIVLSGTEGEWFVSGTVSYCCINANPASASDMVIVDFLPDGTTDTTFGNGTGPNNRSGAALFNSGNTCLVGFAADSNYAMVGSIVNGNPVLTLAGSTGTGTPTVLTDRFTADGQRDTTFGVLESGGPLRKGYALGPSGAAYAAVLDTGVNKVVVSGSSGSFNDFMAARFNNDGTLDPSFGSGGSILIDFGSTSGITSDGGKSVAVRTINGVVDILVAGYTFDSATSKYKIALVDLLDDHFFHVT